jgi:hypothetical protein
MIVELGRGRPSESCAPEPASRETAVAAAAEEEEEEEEVGAVPRSLPRSSGERGSLRLLAVSSV